MINLPMTNNTDYSSEEFVAVDDFERLSGMTTEQIKCEALLFGRGNRQNTLAYIQAAFSGQKLVRVNKGLSKSLNQAATAR